MPVRELQITIGEDVADIPTMREMGAAGYREYIRQELFFMDHHGVFRSAQGEYPILTSRAQLDEFIAYLQEEVQPRLES